MKMTPVAAVIAHSDRAHAILSASSSDRWLECPPSARLNEAAPERGDKTAANKGTLCHEFTESALRMSLGLLSMEDHAENVSEIRSNPLWEEETMQPAVQRALDYGLERIAAARVKFGEEQVIIRLEERVDFSRWVPEGFGSADLIIITPEYIEVIDWKFGTGKVEAKDNSQMKLYGAGTVDAFHMMFGSPVVRMVIVQPFLHAVEVDEIDTDVLLAWMDDYVVPRAKLAWAGEGAFAPSDDTCRWCKVRGQCAARAAQKLAVVGETFKDPALMDDEALAAIFLKIKGIRSWADDIEAHVRTRAIDEGHQFSTLKVVEGKSNRFINDPALARAKLLQAGFTEDDIAEPLPTERKLLGITALEKTVGKKAFGSVLEGLVTKPAGKPEVVPIGDPREPMQVSRSNPDVDFA